MNIKYIAFVSVLLITSKPSFATNNFDLKCETNILGEMSFENNLLTIRPNDKESIIFNPNGEVRVNNKTLSLDNEQTAVAKAYYNDIESSIPLVVDITIEALNITNMALTQVFTGFFGEQTELPNLIDERLTDAVTAIEEHVYQNPDSLTFNSVYLSEDLGFDKSLEQEIDDITQELMSKLMGQLLIGMGQALFSGDSNFEDFEARMETMGADIEKRADELSVRLEDKAEKLCEKLYSLDSAEDKLNNIDDLKNLNLIDLKHKA